MKVLLAILMALVGVATIYWLDVVIGAFIVFLAVLVLKPANTFAKKYGDVSQNGGDAAP